MNRIAYLFKTHLYNETVEYLLNELYDKKPNNVDIYILFNNSLSNNTHDHLNKFNKYNNVIPFDYDDLFNKYTHHTMFNNQFVGNEWMPLFDFYESHNDYDYYILTENDIWFNDVNIFEIIDKIDKDVIYQYDGLCYNEPENNFWLNENVEDHNKIYDKENYAYIMINFLGLSNNALNKIINEYFNTNFACHNEILIPSYVNKLNLSKDYLSNYCNVQFYAFEFDLNHIENNTIYHPVKKLNIINK